MTMIEKVARALDAVMYLPERKTPWEQAPAQHHMVCRKLAQAAIEAMREPTEGMASAGSNFSWFEGRDDEKIAPVTTWQTMIDAALAEKP